MKREIKFRAWSFDPVLEKPQMLSHEDLDRLDREGLEHLFDIINGKDKYIIPMQYTGLKDKNGVEIYEGDIILCKDSLTVKGIIVQDLDSTGFKIQWTKKTDWNKYIHVRIEHINVIGNIYANP